MMTGNSRKGFQGKQEEDEDNSTAHHHQQHHMIGNSIEKLYSKVGSSSSSRQWSSSGLRNPRIVRVSRAFGGKDRHSKVCTIRGLRDRRIRLSVPTAIQLYELQDRLGLNQPSKVIDWLIEATKHDIDKLPPLPIPLGFPQFHQQPNQTLIPHHHDQSISSSHHNFGPNFFDANNSSSTTSFMDKGKWVMKSNNEEENATIVGSAHNLFPSGNNSSSFNPFHSEPSNFLSLFGSHGNSVFPSNNNNSNNNNQHQVDPNNGHISVQFPSSATTPPSLVAAPYYAPPYSSVSLETDPRMMQQQLMNHIQFMTSSNNNPHHLVLPSPMKPLIPTPPFSSRLLDSNENKDTAPS